MFDRIISKNIVEKFFRGKAIILIGARQVGKTTLVNSFCEEVVSQDKQLKLLQFTFDDPDTIEQFQDKGLEFLKRIIGQADIIVLDEAQRVENIGLTIKLLVDYYQDSKQFIVTGSSSLNIIDNTAEPLTGRKFTYRLYPVSADEIAKHESTVVLDSRLEEFLIYGMYPEVTLANTFEDKAELLDELTDSNLYKDVFGNKNVRNPLLIRKLLRALALQIGSEVSYPKLASLLGIDRNTVEEYVDLLNKAFITFTLPAYNLRPRKEISKGKKIYFYDLGVRNALINDFRSLELRQDTGALWENFLIVERLKLNSYQKNRAEQYFWRAYRGGELDYVEVKSGQATPYEFKLTKDKVRVPPAWVENNGQALEVINLKNYLDFVLPG